MDEERQAPEEPPQPDTNAEDPPAADYGLAEATAPAPEAAGGEDGQVPAPPPMDADDPKKWFIVHTYSGFEQKVAESLRSRAQAFGFDDKIGQILIPTEEVVELRGGKKVTSKRLVYPGYVLLQMEMNDALCHAVKAPPRSTAFVAVGPSP